MFKKLKLNSFFALFLTLSIILTPFYSAYADDALYGWAKSIGGTGTDVGQSTAVDSSGNVYTVGYFNGTVDFDPGVGTANLTSGGGNDGFISKLDSSGNYVWAKKIGGSSGDVIYSIVFDSSGNIYTTGYFGGTVDFDPGAGTANLSSISGSADAFISKLDSNGDYVWAKSIGGSSSDYGYDINVDSSGNIYTTGFFSGTADFDPGAGTANLTSGGSDDMFMSRLDSACNDGWGKRNVSSYGDRIYSNILDSSGNIYTTGYFGGTADFDPGAGTANLTSGGSISSFISKLDSSGNYVWAKIISGSGGGVSLYGYGIALDSSNNIYTTGFFSGTADFDPGAGTANLTSAGSWDIFISKLDFLGNFVWAKRIGWSGSD